MGDYVLIPLTEEKGENDDYKQLSAGSHGITARLR
jgi:hypothetical protein